MFVWGYPLQKKQSWKSLERGLGKNLSPERFAPVVGINFCMSIVLFSFRDFLSLEYSEEEGRFTAMHHPFTMPMEEDLPYINTDPGRVRAKAYDIVLNGCEIGGGSVRIHQNDIQEKMFECLGFTKEQAQEQFSFLLNAFKYGVPPHAGLAYGLDRVVMLMLGLDSIRDVIAFPKVKDSSCLMTQAPAPVAAKQLEELGIQVKQS